MFLIDIKHVTKENTYFRQVLHTGQYSQLVAMSLLEGEDIGEEVHPDTDQLIFIVEGEGIARLNGEERHITEHDVVFVPAGIMHNFINSGDDDLKLFTMYAPPEHPDGTIHKTKKDAQAEHTKGGA